MGGLLTVPVQPNKVGWLVGLCPTGRPIPNLYSIHMPVGQSPTRHPAALGWAASSFVKGDVLFKERYSATWLGIGVYAWEIQFSEV